MTSYFITMDSVSAMSLSLQRRRCNVVNVNAPAASYWFRLVLNGPCNSSYCSGHSKSVYDDDDDGNDGDKTRWFLPARSAGRGRSLRCTVALYNITYRVGCLLQLAASPLVSLQRSRLRHSLLTPSALTPFVTLAPSALSALVYTPPPQPPRPLLRRWRHCCYDVSATSAADAV